ncbi:hypothetical protein HYPSUDRAFT_33041 [Hypholoma sublateritium FD-334 SS-4]|uniref:Uncharacterized protein n=1 Tax=Hypholoma sublateritium (strain FD-334 SS-4) TaxID=945553 RepID=A0A0D2PK29_HYPSF|nr:hypothetical protein HYPSUDRAFT_33041 [Hypholoma sublateritium FD-334 SS-4]
MMAESESFLDWMRRRRPSRVPRNALQSPERVDGNDESQRVVRSEPISPQSPAEFFSGSSGAALHDTSFTHVHGPQIQYHMNYHAPHIGSEEGHGQFQALQPFQISSISQPGDAIIDTIHATTPTNPGAGANEPHRRQSIVTQIEYRPDKGNQIYQRHLELKQRGFPLWIPEPNMRLPTSYRRIGINIGDVGIITSSGAFSFLFNVCQPLNHPFNILGLPDGFVPMELKSTDVCEFQDLMPGSYLASATIKKVQNSPEFTGMTFETSAAEGAVLTAPEGSRAMDLQTNRRFHAYAEANVESWYRYVNGPRGIDVKNGELRLVVGCDKVTSYGTAVLSNISQQRINFLKFGINDRDAASLERLSGSTPRYCWESSGLTECRVGPDPAEVAELRQDDNSNAATGGKYRNLCIFVRTLNPRLKDEVFAAITHEIEAVEKQRNKLGSHSSTSQKSQITGTTDGLLSGEDLENVVPMGETVTLTISASAIKYHPADNINKRLLEEASNHCRIAITYDEDWYSVLNEDDIVVPTPNELTERVLAAHHIKEKDGQLRNQF